MLRSIGLQSFSADIQQSVIGDLKEMRSEGPIKQRKARQFDVLSSVHSLSLSLSFLFLF